MKRDFIFKSLAVMVALLPGAVVVAAGPKVASPALIAASTTPSLADCSGRCPARGVERKAAPTNTNPSNNRRANKNNSANKGSQGTSRMNRKSGNMGARVASINMAGVDEASMKKKQMQERIALDERYKAAKFALQKKQADERFAWKQQKSGVAATKQPNLSYGEDADMNDDDMDSMDNTPMPKDNNMSTNKNAPMPAQPDNSTNVKKECPGCKVAPKNNAVQPVPVVPVE